MKRLLTVAIAAVCLPFAVFAGKVTNLDSAAHTLTVEHIGGEKDVIEMAPGETARIYGRTVNLILSQHAMNQVDAEDEYIIKNGTLYIQRRRDISHGH